MRVRITFEVQNRGGVVPFHHQNQIAESFNAILQKAESQNFATYSFFCFSGLKGQTRLGKEGLKYSSRKVTIVLSSSNPDFVNCLTREVLSAEGFKIGELNIVPELVDEELAFNFGTGMKYLCISPIIVTNELLDLIDPMSNEFSDLLYDATLTRMADYGINISEIPEVQKFQLVPDAAYLDRLKSSNKVFSRIYSIGKKGEEQEIRGYTFPFKLFAAKEIQEFVYTCGLGMHCSSGFGMLDLADNNSSERTVPFMTRQSILEA